MNNTFAVRLVKKIAPQIGARVILEPEYNYVGQIIFKNGKTTLFRDNKFNINSLGSIEISRDKNYSKYFLKKFGYQVTKGRSFYSEIHNRRLNKNQRGLTEALNYAKKIGYPVIVKPNNLSMVTLVDLIHNESDFLRLARKIFKKTDVLLVERYYPGKDYRIVVLDGQIISAYQRLHLSVIGDGQKSISELLTEKQQQFNQRGRDTILQLDDFRLKLKLKRLRLNLDSIPAPGQELRLLDNANLSAGGEAIEVTDKLHADYAKLAQAVTRDMCLRLCGVDIIIEGLITEPLANYAIIEINAAPGLDNYASIGKKQQKIVEALYLKVLKSLEKN